MELEDHVARDLRSDMEGAIEALQSVLEGNDLDAIHQCASRLAKALRQI